MLRVVILKRVIVTLACLGAALVFTSAGAVRKADDAGAAGVAAGSTGGGSAKATAGTSARTQEKAVRASFQAMLDGLGKRDKAMMLEHMLPGGTATLMRNGKPVQLTLEALADKVSQPGPSTQEERIHDAMVRVDDSVAIIWAPFELLIDGKVEHCGRDVANLVRVDGRWLIASITDYSRTDCGQRSS